MSLEVYLPLQFSGNVMDVCPRTLEPSLPVPEESPQVVRRVTATLLVDKWIELKPNCNILPKG